jgi:hypothetical protein
MKAERLHLKGGCQVVRDFGPPSYPFSPGGIGLFGQHGDTIASGPAKSLVDWWQHPTVVVVDDVELTTQAGRRLARQILDPPPGAGTEELVRLGHALPGGCRDPSLYSGLKSRGTQSLAKFGRDGPSGVGDDPDLLQLLDPFIDWNAVRQQRSHP